MIPGSFERSFETTNSVCLVQSTNGFGNVTQFLSERIFDNTDTDCDCAEDEGEDQNEFSRNQETGFIIKKVTNHYIEFLF